MSQFNHTTKASLGFHSIEQFVCSTSFSSLPSLTFFILLSCYLVTALCSQRLRGLTVQGLWLSRFRDPSDFIAIRNSPASLLGRRYPHPLAPIISLCYNKQRRVLVRSANLFRAQVRVQVCSECSAVMLPLKVRLSRFMFIILLTDTTYL